jgi:hypothetical protein
VSPVYHTLELKDRCGVKRLIVVTENVDTCAFQKFRIVLSKGWYLCITNIENCAFKRLRVVPSNVWYFCMEKFATSALKVWELCCQRLIVVPYAKKIWHLLHSNDFVCVVKSLIFVPSHFWYLCQQGVDNFCIQKIESCAAKRLIVTFSNVWCLCQQEVDISFFKSW